MIEESYREMLQAIRWTSVQQPGIRTKVVNILAVTDQWELALTGRWDFSSPLSPLIPTVPRMA